MDIVQIVFFPADKRMPMNDAPITLETVQVHGRLYHAYLKSAGLRTLKAAFMPSPMKWYTYVLWAVIAVPPILLQVWVFSEWKFAWLTPFIQGAIMYWVFAPFVNYCVRREMPCEYADVGITGSATTQPKYLHAALLRFKWFRDYVVQHEKITKDQIDRCIEFVELIEKDSPPSWTAYFRHPLPLLLLGIAVFSVNAKIANMIASSPIEFEKLSIVLGVALTWGLGMGWVLFSLRHARAESRWFFLRCLRWTSLSMHPETGGLPHVVANAERVGVPGEPGHRRLQQRRQPRP